MTTPYESFARQQRADRRARRQARQILEAACAQVGIRCGYVQVGDGASEIKFKKARPASNASTSAADTTEPLTVEEITVLHGVLIPTHETVQAVYTICDNREAILRDSDL